MRTKQMYQPYYLNNTGTRFVLRNNNNRNIKVQVIADNSIIVRRVKYLEQYGFACKVYYNYQGVLQSTLLDCDNVSLLWTEL